MNPVNLYTISTTTDENTFNTLYSHQTKCIRKEPYKHHEIRSLQILAGELFVFGVKFEQLDDFFLGYEIPHIGHEFDLLKFTDDLCLNIELKSQSVSNEKISDQLVKNKFYLKSLGKSLTLLSIITDTNPITCYRLSENNSLISITFDDVINDVKRHANNSLNHIDDLFQPSKYLVSPLNSFDQFIDGQYFLTQRQEEIKNEILAAIDKSTSACYFHISGEPGTGKTLLLHDIAKSLSQKGPTIVIHCGLVEKTSINFSDDRAGYKMFPIGMLDYNKLILDSYSYILIDEAHRIYPRQLDFIVDVVENKGCCCVIASDPGQVMSFSEQKFNIADKIHGLPLTKDYLLPYKIRTNKELFSFIRKLFNLHSHVDSKFNYSNVEVVFARPLEVVFLIHYFKSRDYVFINYSTSYKKRSPFNQYFPSSNYDTHHVIGQDFDNVLMLMDESFYYDENGQLQCVEHPNPDYIYTQLLYQGLTRARERIAIIVVNNLELMSKIATIFKNN